MNWKLQMVSLCINVMIPSFLIITDLYLFLPLYQRYLKKDMYNRLVTYLNEYTFCSPISLVSENNIQPIWP